MDDRGILGMRECPICKKKFIFNSLSIYKLTIRGRIKYYCSYTCWRKAGGGNYKKDPKIIKQLRGDR